MSSRRESNNTSQDLREIQDQLRRLSITVDRVVARHKEVEQQHVPVNTTHSLKVGDIVTFQYRLVRTRGTIVDITSKRVRIRPDGYQTTVLRAPKNVNLVRQA